MSVISPKLNPIQWWDQFPTDLRLITKTRFFASLGAGGVIYLTPLVFTQQNFSATDIGSGLALAAVTGTIARFASGILLDKGINCSRIIQITACIAIAADLTLFNTQNYAEFLIGQSLFGIATGLYWPSIELAVPISCGNFPSSKGFALGRSADALGISIGATIGSIAAWIGAIKLIYIFDIIWLFLLIVILQNKLLTNKIKNERFNKDYQTKPNKTISKIKLFKPLIPILLISLLATGILSLIQSALPIDLVKGGINRPAFSEGWSSALIAIQLILLVFIQWPIGKWIGEKNFIFGFKVSLFCLGIGCLLLGLSSLLSFGGALVLLAQFPIALGLAAFLPTATEAIIKEAPLEKKGFALAIFSQCFAVSAFLAPLISGRLLDIQGNGFTLWISVFALCFWALVSLNKIKYLESK